MPIFAAGWSGAVAWASPGYWTGLTHSFVIERLDGTAVKFRQHEDFSGILLPFVGFDPYRKGWAKMNAALKQRSEQQPAEHGSPKRREER